MVEETVTAPTVGAEVPAAAPVSADTPATSEAVTPVAGDVSTPSTTEEFSTKFDPKTLTPEGLKVYKKLQADYTRARQADKAKLEQFESQIRSYQPLLSDKDVQAKAYYLQNGRYPDGYQPWGKAEQPAATEPQINPDEIQDPLMKQMYLDNQKLKQESELRAKQDHEKMVENTNKGVTSFYDGLKPEHKTLWQENIKDIKENATLYASKGIPVDVVLRRAFNAACADKLAEMARLDGINSMKVKAQAPKPETSVNVASLVQGEFNTPAEAVRAAIASSRGK